MSHPLETDKIKSAVRLDEQLIGQYTPQEWAAVKKEYVSQLEQNAPRLWRKCYPRIYHDPGMGSYHSPKEVAFDMANAAFKISLGFMGDNEKAECIWASRMSEYRVPIYWLSPEIVEAIKQTKPHMTIDMREMHLPFEAAAFMLPKGTLVHPEEGEAKFITYVRTTQGQGIPTIAEGGPRVWVPTGNGVFGVYAHTKAEHFIHWTMPSNVPVDLANLDELVNTFEDEKIFKKHYSEFASQFFQATLNHSDNVFMARVAHLIFGTILLMTARPIVVRNATLANRVPAKAGKAPKEFWTPATIGAGYKIQHRGAALGGSHASPRYHWVKGAFKMQAHGKNRKLHKKIWVEPYTRGIKEETE